MPALETVIKERLTGSAIKEYLETVGLGHPHGFYSIFRKVKPSTSYGSVRRYFYILRVLGLIEFVKEEPGRGRWPKRLYRLTAKGKAKKRWDPEWIAPQRELYPATRWGATRYKRAKEKGKVILGRRKKYRIA